MHAIRDITSQFEVDFVALTFTRDGEDVDSMRDFLDKLGLEQTKILAKVCQTVATVTDCHYSTVVIPVC